MKRRFIVGSNDSDEALPKQPFHSLRLSAVDDVAAIQAQLQELKLIVTKQSTRIQHLEGCLSRAVNSSELRSGAPSSVTPSIHILPVELLVKIFNVVVYAHASDVKSSCQHAIILSHVCRDWRAITLDVPRLWCNILTSLKVSGLKSILKRSKSFPLNIFCDTSSDSPRLRILTTYLTQSDTMQRCRSLSWTSSEAALSGIMYTLNSTKGCSFTNLSTLDLSAQLRGSAFLEPIFEHETPLPKFPKLTHVRLACISPEELPPSVFPALRTIYIYFPQDRIQLQGISRPPSLRMSNMLSLLSRTPQLEHLTLDEAIPILDVRLVPSHTPDMVLSFAMRRSRRTNTYIQPIKLSRLNALSWYHCPPKDLWRFFHFVSLTHLQTLHLLVDLFTFRWQGEREGEMFDMETTTPLTDHPISTLVVKLPHLENLVLEFSDIEGLTTCFRKFLVPSLKTLSLAFTPPKYLEGYNLVPDLPTPESIFRDPPMPMLSALTISNLNLDLKNILSLLGYTPSLRSLSLEGCIGVTPLVTSLSARGLNSWICPKLDSLTFIKCDDLEPNSLHKLILRRNTASDILTDTQPTGRPLKPLRRRTIKPLTDSSNVFADARNWPPSRIKSIRVEGCKRVHDWDMDSRALSSESYVLY